MPAALLDDVTVTYGRHGVRGVDRLSLTVAAGRVTGLLGPNGAGKSTAVAVLAGLTPVSRGRAETLGGRPGRPEARRDLHVMLQEEGLPTGARGPELVRHVAALRSAPESARPLIERLGIDAFGGTPIRRLSGGERRRVSLACALVGAPRMVILDEPTAGLDPRGRGLVWELVRDLREGGVTVVLATHLLDEAEALCDDIAIVAGGRCIVESSLADLLAQASDQVAFDGPIHLDIAGLLHALPEGFSATEASPGRYVVRGPVDPRVLATVTSWCAQHGVMPRNLRAGQGSLEDAYVRLVAESEAAP
ncbi:MAG: ABC transporter ATP-binding protein [Actinomycetales bacterium]|nr:ABC transporter ATP-binding protein [Actinomycetales bacterium]